MPFIGLMFAIQAIFRILLFLDKIVVMICILSANIKYDFSPNANFNVNWFDYAFIK